MRANRALEIAVKAVGHAAPDLSLLAPAHADDAITLDTVAATGVYGIFCLDLTRTTEGRLHVIEANGSNFAGSSTVHGDDRSRVKHILDTLFAKGRPEPGVVLLPYQPGALHVAEFHMRQLRLYESLAAVLGSDNVAMAGPDEVIADIPYVVVCADIRALVAHIACVNGNLTYQGRPVLFSSNPNLLPELVRRGTVKRHGNGYDCDLSVFHDGALVPLVHDKATQQQLCVGTGITPLQCAEAWSLEEAETQVHHFHRGGRVAVLKMNGGSGGAGITFLPPYLDAADIRKNILALAEEAAKKYGDNMEQTLFPLRLFEFARSSGYPLEDGAHLWDIRLQCLIRPDQVRVEPCIIRLCPYPFDGVTYAWNAVVNNLTGRPGSMQFIRSAQDARARAAAGISDDVLAEIMRACAGWCVNAALRYWS